MMNYVEKRLKVAGVTRRTFLGTASACAAAACCPSLLSAGCAGGDSGTTVVLPSPVSGLITLQLDQPADGMQQLAQVGGSVLGKSPGMPDPIILVRADASTINAIDARCTHQGCIVGFNAVNYSLDCPCHGSSFELDGTIINGPAARQMTTYPTTFDGKTLTVQVG